MYNYQLYKNYNDTITSKNNIPLNQFHVRESSEN